MKKLVCVLVALAVVVGLAIFLPAEKTNCEYLRLQIYANSNTALDQGVKLQIKDQLIEYLTPYLNSAADKTRALSVVNEQNVNMLGICNKILKENNIKYSAKISLKKQFFEKETGFDAGTYDAIVVELGSAAGKNENCLIYPPLNVNSGKVKFKSKILSSLKKLFN